MYYQSSKRNCAATSYTSTVMSNNQSKVSKPEESQKRSGKEQSMEKKKSKRSKHEESSSSTESETEETMGTPRIRLSTKVSDKPSWKSPYFFTSDSTFVINDIRVRGFFDETKAMKMVYLMKKNSASNYKNVGPSYLELTFREAKMVKKEFEKLVQEIKNTSPEESIRLLKAKFADISDIRDENYWHPDNCVVIEDHIKIRPIKPTKTYLLRLHTPVSLKTRDEYQGWCGPCISFFVGEATVLCEVLTDIFAEMDKEEVPIMFRKE